MIKYFKLLDRVINFAQYETKEYVNLYNNLLELPEGIWSPKEYGETVKEISDYINREITAKIIELNVSGFSDTTEEEINRKIKNTTEDFDNLYSSFKEDLEKLRSATIDLLLEDEVDTMYDDEEFNNEN